MAFAEVDKFVDSAEALQQRHADASGIRGGGTFEPEILLVDEVLSVGDIQFQKKCMGKMGGCSEVRPDDFVCKPSDESNTAFAKKFCGSMKEISGYRGPPKRWQATSAAGREIYGGERVNDRTAKACFSSWKILEPQNDSNAFGPSTSHRFSVKVRKSLRNVHHDSPAQLGRSIAVG